MPAEALDLLQLSHVWLIVNDLLESFELGHAPELCAWLENVMCPGSTPLFVGQLHRQRTGGVLHFKCHFSRIEPTSLGAISPLTDWIQQGWLSRHREDYSPTEGQ